jgi:small subunit ribosomal protein S6
MYAYEGMFLVDPVKHGADAAAVEGTVKGLLEKHGAKIQQFETWDERRLAYEIKGHRRGVYFLTHFEMPGDAVDALHADCKLTETILRQMLVRLEDNIPTYLEKSAQYYEKVRSDQDMRRPPGRREEGPEGAARADAQPPVD